MRISERQIGGVVVLDVHGPIVGRPAAEAIEETLRRLRADGACQMVVNLADVPLVDSSGLGALVAARVALRDASGTFKLACVTERIDDLVVITRLVTVFDTYDSVEEAIGAPIPVYEEVEAPHPSLMAFGALNRFLHRA
jgi:anti-sigma B factor antagonist